MRSLYKSLYGLAAMLAGVALGTAHAQAPASPVLARGAALAAVGGCRGCHTAKGGPSYAGGGVVSTPFGVIYGTNITPDHDTGIGGWTLADFDKAVRRGLRPGGQPLYPAMPFDHYAALTDADVSALYAFIMTRPAVRSTPPANRLIPPLGLRPLMHLWRVLFFRPAPAPKDRGAYLVQALGHCGACHTPHGMLGQEHQRQALAGGWSEGWYAPALNAASPASSAWTEERLYAYLTTGLDTDHAAAAASLSRAGACIGAAPRMVAAR